MELIKAAILINRKEHFVWSLKSDSGSRGRKPSSFYDHMAKFGQVPQTNIQARYALSFLRSMLNQRVPPKRPAGVWKEEPLDTRNS